MPRPFLIALACACGLVGPLAGQVPELIRVLAEQQAAYEAKDYPKALDILRTLEASPGYPDVIATVSHRFVETGDCLLEDRSYSAALAAYAAVRPRNQVMAVQTARLMEMRRLKEDYEKSIAAAAQAKQAPPPGMEDKLAALTTLIEFGNKDLTLLRDLTDHDTVLHYRIARCFFNWKRYWPAAVAFESVAFEHPDFADAPAAFFGAIVCQWHLNRSEATHNLCLAYIKKYPKGAKVETVAEFNAKRLLEEDKYDETVNFVDYFLKSDADTTIREILLNLSAKAKFQGTKYDAAAEAYDALRKEFATGGDIEEWAYQRALCDFMRNDYEATLKAFEAYERDYPDGAYVADVRYRRGIIQLALKDYKNLITDMTDLLKNEAAKEYTGMIYTLLGDACQKRGVPGQAASYFVEAVRHANGDQKVLEYSLEMATMLLRGEKRWDDLRQLWQDFIDKNPNHPMALRGVAELSKLLTRAGKKDEARAMLTKNILQHIHNPNSEYVEMLLSQLVSLYVPPRAVNKGAPMPNLVKPEADLVKALGIPDNERTATYLARITYAKSELARMGRDPQGNKRFLSDIAAACKPEDLSPVLLSIVGQFLLNGKQYDQAAPLFVRLRDAHPQSVFSDAAPVGLGDIAFAKKDYVTAAKEYDNAINKSAGGTMLKEATFGRALSLFNLQQSEEAKKLFEKLLQSKEWGGVKQAGANYYLGEIAAANGDFGPAHDFFQRTYIVNPTLLEYAPKAYLRAADMLQAMGRRQDATDTLLEFLKYPKYAATAEAATARQRLGL